MDDSHPPTPGDAYDPIRANPVVADRLEDDRRGKHGAIALQDPTCAFVRRE
jgi:hypothetical protein